MSVVSQVSLSMPVRPYAPAVQEYISAYHTNPKPQSCFVTQSLTARLCDLPLIIWVYILTLFFHDDYGSVEETLMLY